MDKDKVLQQADLDEVVAQFSIGEVLNSCVRALEKGGDSKSVAASRIFGAAKRIFENSK